jgi:protein TonB
MVKRNKIIQLFANRSCLSADTIDSFLTGKLSSQEMESVRKHINECEFCADAVEGYKNIQLKDNLSDTVNRLNKKINLRSSRGVNRLMFVNKRIIAYSSLAASILILLGLFLLINNLKIRNNNIVTDNLILKGNKPASPDQKEQSKEPGSLVSFDSFPGEVDSRIKTSPKKEIMAVTSQSELKSEKTGTKDIIKPEAVYDISEKESYKETEEVKYHDISISEAPVSKADETSGPLMYETSKGRNKAGLARKEYSRPRELSVDQMQSDEYVMYDQAMTMMTDELPGFGNNGLEEFRDYVQKNLQYPRKVKKAGIEGEVLVKFAVDTTGRVVDTEIITTADSALNREALRVVSSSPLWTPGKKDGKPVKVSYVIPVIFRID